MFQQDQIFMCKEDVQTKRATRSIRKAAIWDVVSSILSSSSERSICVQGAWGKKANIKNDDIFVQFMSQYCWYQSNKK